MQQLTNELLHWITESINDAYAYHRVLTDSRGNPVDYIYLDVNKSFEELTGLNKEDIIGKKASEFYPGIYKSDFDCIREYGKLAVQGGEVNFEHYFNTTGYWYNIKAFSSESGYFATILRCITDNRDLWDKQAEADILSILAESRELPWALQMILLKTLEISAFPAGAIRLMNGDDYFYREHQDLGSDFLKGVIKSMDREGFIVQNESCEKAKQCFFEHIANIGGAGAHKTEQGSIFIKNAEKVLENNFNILEASNNYCIRCFSGGSSYKTIVVIPLKALEETIGVFYLLHDSPDFVEFNRIAYIESLVRPIGYTIKQLQDREYIQESERRFRLLVHNARDIIFRFTLTPEITCEYISPVVEKITGYTQEDFYKDPMVFYEITQKEDRHLMDKLFRLKIESDHNTQNETISIRWLCKNKQVIWVELQVSNYTEAVDKDIAIEGIIRDVTERVETEVRLRSSREKINSLSIKLLQAYEQERARLARELHDEVGQALTAVKLDLQMLGATIESQLPSFVEHLSQSIKMINDTIVNVRRQVVYLRPPILDEFILVDLVQDMVREMSLRGGFKSVVKVSGNFTGKLSKDLEIALYRCIQEAITNVSRHARADSVIVEINYKDDTIFARVIDDGLGFECTFPDSSTGHVGLKGMRERVSLLGGQFNVLSAPGKGTEINIVIPVNEDCEV